MMILAGIALSIQMITEPISPAALEDLIDQLLAVEEWPAPELLAAIAAHGAEAVPPLCAMLAEPEAEGWPIHYGSYLLAYLGDPAAIPALANCCRQFDSDFLEDIASALSVFGAAAIDPALAVARQPDLGWYQRAMASNGAVAAAGKDPALRAQVAGVFRELLGDLVARADALSDEEIGFVTSLVTDLAHMPDPQARDLIRAAFDAELVEGFFIGRDDVEKAYRQDEQFPEPFDAAAWFKDYPEEYQNHLKRLAREKRREQERARPVPALLTEPPSGPLPGRNAPCWCGSSQKYKACHYQQDQERSAAPAPAGRKRRRR